MMVAHDEIPSIDAGAGLPSGDGRGRAGRPPSAPEASLADGEGLRRLGLADLVKGCAEESDRFKRGQGYDDCYGLELFRRAVVERDPAAWEMVHAQYRALVRDWIGRHAQASRIDDHDDLATRAFARFWQALKPEKFASFPSLSSLLRYLKLCAAAALIDEVRAQRAWEGRRAGGELVIELPDERQQVDALVADDLAAADLWRAIEAELPDPAERLVIYLTCVAGLKPREVALRYGDAFPSVGAVYQRKQVALERLRRSGLAARAA
jgi:RNA polymerase sigma factor (sigma-70 family)